VEPTGYKLHAGRSRNEQIAADLRLFVRAKIDELQNLLADCAEAILARAESAGGAAMPGFTHWQPAEPVLVAHWLLAYVEMFLRDSDRLASCRKRANLCPLGSGAIAGATLALDRRAIAAELGFDDITANSMDATSDRDFALEFVQALSLLALHLSRWAEEMILFSTQLRTDSLFYAVTVANACFAAAIVCCTSWSVWAALMKAASNCEGGR
jgi:argininosuccinate lyase